MADVVTPEGQPIVEVSNTTPDVNQLLEKISLLEKRVDSQSRVIAGQEKTLKTVSQQLQTPVTKATDGNDKSIADPIVTERIRSMEEVLKKAEEKEQRNREKLSLSIIRDGISKAGGDGDKADYYHYKWKDKIAFDEEDNPIVKINEAEAMPLTKYVSEFMETKDGKSLLPSKPIVTDSTLFGKNNNYSRNQYTMENAIADPNLAKAWQESDPNGYRVARDAFFSNGAVLSRLKQKKS